MGFAEMTERRFIKIEKKQTLIQRMLLGQFIFCVLFSLQFLGLHDR